MTPVVSILMPVYNTAPWLREAMDSILGQTFEDFELIALNDCSPDNAEEILDAYTDPRIVRYRGAQNAGLANILNIGLDMARGKYIARMDSDDISLPTRLAVQVQYLEAHPKIDLCSTAMQLFGKRSEVWVRSANPEKVKIDALFFSPVLHASSMWRRESFEGLGLRFRQERVPSEDYDLWTRALIGGLRMSNMPDVLYLYRIRSGQATADYSTMGDCVRHEYIQRSLPALNRSMHDELPQHLFPVLRANIGSRYFSSFLLIRRLLKLRKHKTA